MQTVWLMANLFFAVNVVNDVIIVISNGGNVINVINNVLF